MILVAGLGNPGQRYENTRHNIGFRVVDRLAERAAAPSWKTKFFSEFAQIELSGRRVGLLKPGTYMNRSGRAVGAAVSFYKLDPADVLVVHDELDLPFGSVKLKRGGGEAGHNGLRSVSQHLDTKDYPRLRVGVGKPPPDFRGSGADYVLQSFALAERPLLTDLVDRAAEAAIAVVEEDLERAMNQTNRSN